MKKPIFFFCFQLISLAVVFAQQDNIINVNGKYFTLSLPGTWQETDDHVFLDQVKTGTGMDQSKMESLFKCYVDSENYYNVLIIAEKFLSKRILRGVTIEQLVGRSGEKREYSGQEFLITTDPFVSSLTGIGAHTIYEDAVYYFQFILDNESLDIADQTLSTISFVHVEDKKDNEKKPGIFTGFWHGIRTPFVFIINFFRKNKLVIFSETRTIGYTIGYLLGIFFILSIIFGSSRRRNN